MRIPWFSILVLCLVVFISLYYIFKQSREKQIHKSRMAFLRQKSTLFETYPGQFAAFYKGGLLIIDPDKSNLIEIIQREYGNIPALIGHLVPSAEEPIIL